MIKGYFTIDNDDELHYALSQLLDPTATLHIGCRVYCEVPVEDYNNKLDSTIGDGRKLMSSVYKNFYESETGVYVLVGEDDGYGVDATGSRDLTGNPITKEEFAAWILKYGVENFHVDFPREVV